MFCSARFAYQQPMGGFTAIVVLMLFDLVHVLAVAKIFRYLFSFCIIGGNMKVSNVVFCCIHMVVRSYSSFTADGVGVLIWMSVCFI